MPFAFAALHLCGGDVAVGEEVGDGGEAAFVVFRLFEHVVERSTYLNVDVESVVEEVLVHRRHHVGVGRAVHSASLAVHTLVGAGEHHDCRRVVFFFIYSVGVVGTYTTHDVEPGEDVVLERCVEHVALLAGFAEHTLLGPVGVLHGECGAVLLFPVLCHDVARGVEALEHAHVVEVLAAWEEVEGSQGVEVFA